MASRLVRSGLVSPPTCEPARAASDVLQSKSILELPPSLRHGPFCSVEVSNLRIKSHLPAAHAGLSAIGSGIWTDACASRSRSAQGLLQLCSRMWMSRPRSIHKAHNTALLTSNCTGTVSTCIRHSSPRGGSCCPSSSPAKREAGTPSRRGPPTLSGPRAGQSFPAHNGPSRPCCAGDPACCNVHAVNKISQGGVSRASGLEVQGGQGH